MSIFNHCVTQLACKVIEFGEVMQNKGYYAVQGHSRSPMSVPNRKPVGDFLLVINTNSES